MSVDTIILGGLPFGSKLTPDESFEFLLQASSIGLSTVDLGSLYGNGNALSIISEFNKCYPESSYKLHYKIGLAKVVGLNDAFGVKLNSLTYDFIVSEALRAFDVNGAPIYNLSLHAYCDSVPISEQLSAIEYLIQKRIILNYGICNFDSYQLTNWLNHCRTCNIPYPSTLDCHFNLLEQRARFDLMPLLEGTSTKLIPYRALCRGLLADRYKVDIPVSSRATNSWRVKRYVNSSNLDLVNRIRSYVGNSTDSLLGFCLAWCLSFECVENVCIGASTIGQLRAVVNSLSHPFSDEFLIGVDDVFSTSERSSIHSLPLTFFET